MEKHYYIKQNLGYSKCNVGYRTAWGTGLGWKNKSDRKDNERVDSTGWWVVANWDAQNRHEHRNAFPILKEIYLFCSTNLWKRVENTKLRKIA
jgi:hypothetical protein